MMRVISIIVTLAILVWAVSRWSWFEQASLLPLMTAQGGKLQCEIASTPSERRLIREKIKKQSLTHCVLLVRGMEGYYKADKYETNTELTFPRAYGLDQEFTVQTTVADLFKSDAPFVLLFPEQQLDLAVTGTKFNALGPVPKGV